MSNKLSEIKKLQRWAQKIRQTTLQIVYQTQSPHLGSSFSIADILTALYFKVLNVSPKTVNNPKRDRFILSKGHGCPALYAALYHRGFISQKCLAGFACNNGSLGQHPDQCLERGIEITSGSLGHGLSIGAGMALAGKRDKLKYKVFVLLGDGELNEGSCWEAVMFASHFKLDNLVAIVDYNKLQIFDRTYRVMKLAPLAKKWQAFGWDAREINGHDFKQIISALEKTPLSKNKPSVILAHTRKGQGVSFMENKCAWHSKCPNEKEYQKALKELL